MPTAMNIFRRAYVIMGILASCLPSLTTSFTMSIRPSTAVTSIGLTTRTTFTTTTPTTTPTTTTTMRYSSSALAMVKNRGLEVRREGATPTEGGMTLYMKAGPDGKSVGDCPFAHFVRMVLEEKGLEYDVKPCVAETKPAWLLEYYDGKMPALRHRKECYVESDVIAEYLDFFFQNPSLKVDRELMDAAEGAVEGLFPAIAKYLKHTPDGDAQDVEKKMALEQSLERLNTHLSSVDGPYMTGHSFSLVDCGLAPKLYHMKTGVDSFKNGSIDFATQFPAVDEYMKTVFDRPSFQQTVYPTEVVTWGWGNARN